ncbi:hypothetical protein A2803_02960 [Candidatus Woesebacteria bacterium RIFCSPHIGHO2_01_FULL_44_21]|uniref:Antitoxin n=1 Tax=Candidatus Woesebacteria bacterium RIFCSPHIGHO2_01_FULL_44_21 TaxID=1802503 RepID=A0A1F7Z0I3_9BACT|nr:MAG: hypothetical protein A2803_02960 [Candidatus Woesebacteria bacterium RIFCSPHIGHO2_01_FULL_44_21]OGM69225.1 MAG: hypothetical protein A2897_04420 [Candidatus Woesebacteria bacterium RIFCSPLOWO2_01_FULL_44_24b]
MNTVTISELKTRPARAIAESLDYPVAVLRRNKTQAYIVGKELFEKLVAALEDLIDRKAVEKTDFSKGKDFEDIASELGI